jgi:uncharacterized protein DUF4337
MSSADTKPADAAPETPKTKWDKLLTSTPVVLTVLATLLAGLSSSEMTQAQYHRSLAAQNQSKVGDQWGFFQAKRIRGTSMDATADVIATLAEPGTIDAAHLREFNARLVADLGRAEKEADGVVSLAQAATGSSADSLRKAAADLRQALQKATQAAGVSDQNLRKLLGEEDTARALEVASTLKLPLVENKRLDDADIKNALEAIASRKPEKETVALMKSVREPALHAAIDAAQDNAQRFDAAVDPLTKKLEALGASASDQVKLTRSVSRAARDFNLSLDEAGIKDTEELRRKAAGVQRIAESKKAQAAEIYADVTAAWHRFNSVRYRREARYNQETAGLYEVQVRKSSWASDRARQRSAYFFFGMLAAQAGVTIATIALAVRLKSVLWGLASVAGLAAICIAVFVYCFV